MVKEAGKKHELAIVGLGGAGVLTVGRQVALAGSRMYRYVSYYPSYSWQMRGGSSECAVILSNEEIACPILEQPDNMLVLASNLFKTFIDRIRPGGLVVVGSLGLDKDIDSAGFNMVIIPEVEKEASAIGAAVVANTIMLGAYIQITGSLSPKAVEAELENQFGDKEKVLALNIKALQRGIELAKSVV